MASSNKKNGKNIVITIVVIVVIVVLLVAGAFAYGWIALMPGYTSPDKAVSNYFSAVSNEDSMLYKKSCYTTRWRDSVNVDSEISNALSMQSGATYSNVKVVSMESLDDEFADKMESSLSVRYGLDQKISKIKQVNFTVDTVFDGQASSSGTITRYCYKAGGKWFFLADPGVIVDIGVEN